MKRERTMIKGVTELFGKEAKRFRQLLRSFEDTLDSRGFDQLMLGVLASDEIFRQNLDFLGPRFMKNLVYAIVDGEVNVVVLPEGTMKTYDFIKRHNLDRAKIFYNEQFVRNEPVDEVDKGKTRVFYQTGFEIFNYPLIESGIEAMETVYHMIVNAGIDDVVIRMADKRLIIGMLNEYGPEDQEIIRKVMEESNDSPVKFEQLYRKNGGTNPSIKHMIDFLTLGRNEDLTLDQLAELDRTRVYSEGIKALDDIRSGISDKVKLQILPFMTKSWDACDRLLFDARSPRFNGALAGGGNLTYGAYKKDLPKSGAGVGITRIHEILHK